ncbi:DUF2752 domain-containing protein [Microbacterium sp.]|uniref:DUF2752 domain-containing protein n=1 Tax=Microbacterium sp. TaxID=51671 RepID=UPI0037362C81
MAPCLIRERFGWLCPGCGGLRAFALLVRGDVVGSLAFNPLIVGALVLGPAIWLGGISEGPGGRVAFRFASFAFTALVIYVAIGRNVIE